MHPRFGTLIIQQGCQWSRVLGRVLSRNLTFVKASEKNNNCLKMTKDLMSMVKDLLRVHYRKFSYFCGTHFKMTNGIMTDNIIPGHIRFLGIQLSVLYSFWKTYINNLYPKIILDHVNLKNIWVSFYISEGIFDL